MDEARRRLLTRLLIFAMILTAAWGGWLIAKNDGRRGRIGRPPKSQTEKDKNTQSVIGEIFKTNIRYGKIVFVTPSALGAIHLTPSNTER